MKWLIASDIHGSEFYCSRLIEACEREKADRMLLLGDLLYHGPRNDLPEGYAPKKVIELLNAHKNEIFCIRGNCEAEVDQMVLEFPIMADYAVIPLGSRAIYATHGHIYNKDKLPPLKTGDILLYGHTHIPMCETVSPVQGTHDNIGIAPAACSEGTNPGIGSGTDTESGIICMNPGSVSIPKAGSQHSYMTLETEDAALYSRQTEKTGEKEQEQRAESGKILFSWKTLDGEVYRTYQLGLR